MALELVREDVRRPELFDIADEGRAGMLPRVVLREVRPFGWVILIDRRV